MSDYSDIHPQVTGMTAFDGSAQDATGKAGIATQPDEALPENPFPGLKPYEDSDHYPFMGRERETSELLDRLGGHHFLAVIGVSGSGKSSLVLASLIPEVRQGFVRGGSTLWSTAVIRPGKKPIDALATELEKRAIAGPGVDVRETLAEGSEGLKKLAGKLVEGYRLLIVVDQFEEIFRYKDLSRSDGPDSKATAIKQADAFVSLLLKALADERVFIVITMRSDFIGDCAQFQGLPEEINKGQYLIPALSEKQKKEIIQRPPWARRADVAAPLVQRLLSDVGPDPAHLPVLQHALRRIWDHWVTHADLKLKDKTGKYAVRIDVQNYEAIGGFDGAMDKHARKALSDLSGLELWITKRLFQRITSGREGGGIPTRRPTELKDIFSVTGATEGPERQALIREIIARFRSEEFSFLTSPEIGELNDESIIDISHESLCIRWALLKKWVEEEAHSRWWYDRVTESAILATRRQDFRAPLPDGELSEVLKYLPNICNEEPSPDHEPWTQPWSLRYNKDFDAVEEYVKYSLEEQKLRESAKEEAHQRELKFKDSELRLRDLEIDREKQEKELARERQENELRLKDLELKAEATKVRESARKVKQLAAVVMVLVALVALVLSFYLLTWEPSKRLAAQNLANIQASFQNRYGEIWPEVAAFLLVASHNRKAIDSNENLLDWENIDQITQSRKAGETSRRSPSPAYPLCPDGSHILVWEGAPNEAKQIESLFSKDLTPDESFQKAFPDLSAVSPDGAYVATKCRANHEASLVMVNGNSPEDRLKTDYKCDSDPVSIENQSTEVKDKTIERIVVVERRGLHTFSRSKDSPKKIIPEKLNVYNALLDTPHLGTGAHYLAVLPRSDEAKVDKAEAHVAKVLVFDTILARKIGFDFDAGRRTCPGISSKPQSSINESKKPNSSVTSLTKPQPPNYSTTSIVVGKDLLSVGYSDGVVVVTSLSHIGPKPVQFCIADPFQQPSPVSFMALSGDGKLLAIANANAALRVVEFGPGSRPLSKSLSKSSGKCTISEPRSLK